MRRLLWWAIRPIVRFVDDFLDCFVPGRVGRKFSQSIENNLLRAAGLATQRGHMFDAGNMMVALRDRKGATALELAIAIGEKDQAIYQPLVGAVFDYIAHNKIPPHRYGGVHEEGQQAPGKAEEALEGGEKEVPEEGSGEG